ncbi:MAG: FHA domain-containing protein [Chloroflexi bacterium]|nr:FHA domain-containing protein [Chloroflexota bacterium]
MTDQAASKICPLCETANDESATHCVQCGTPLLGVTTIVITDTPPDLSTKPDIRIAHETDGRQEAIALHIAGQAEPIILKNNIEIILGRRIPGSPPPTIDLADYHGHLLGVSRQHARVTHTAEGYMVEDLNSQNGTWLNENRLTPNKPQLLRSGDQLRLGHLILLLYFPVRYVGQTTNSLDGR